MIQHGRAVAMTGDFARARALLERGRSAAERIAERGDAAGGSIWLSEIARREGDLDEARTQLERALALIEPRKARADFGTSAALAYSKRGCLAEQEGDLADAAEWHGKARRALDRILALPIDRLIGTLVQGFAALAAARGEHVRAAELLGGAHTLQGVPDVWSLEIDRATASAVDALGQAAFDEAYERGRGMTRDQALAL
jgi:tetratricopeptide (TPR) repeat protein